MSCPAALAKGPSWPQPVILPKTILSFRSKQTSGPNPNLSITPGLKPSNIASAVSTSFKTTSAPSSDFKSTAIDFFPLLEASCLEPVPIAEALSTLITSAPRSAKTIPQNGPGPMPAISIIFKPFSGPIIFSLAPFSSQWFKDYKQLWQ